MRNKGKSICSDCRHFFVTHDKYKPWGCRKFGFKSKKIPGLVVIETSGTNCAFKSERGFLGQDKRKLADGG